VTGKIIVVVDDEPGITLLCERLLKREGYKVKTFNDPQMAMKYFEQNTIDMLLVDIRLPGKSGFDLITEVKKKQPDIAVLVMTGFGTVETAIQALRQGVDGLLLKPFETGTDLIRAVMQAQEDNQKKRDIASIQALRPLFEITESFMGETRPERLVDLVLNAVCVHLQCTNAGFYLFSDDKNTMQLQAGRGKLLPEAFKDPDRNLINRTYISDTPSWVNASGPGDPKLQAVLVSQGLSSVLCSPISRLNVHGVLYAGRDVENPIFREVDWEMFLLLSRQMAVAMENARLYDQLRNYVRQVEDSQQALVRAEKMVAAGRLTASIAHEINNPLQAVKNCLHLAVRADIPKKKQQEYLNMANQELDRLISTVHRMLDFYRPGSIAPQPVEISALLQHVINLLSPQLKERNIRVTMDISSKLPLIIAVGSQLQQVFINLILNAYDAMPGGGGLKISARRVSDDIEIRVKDTGPGIPAAESSHIFEPFVSTKEGGTGLGLSVSYGIISAHGGSIDLVPHTRSGACFRVKLPVKGDA
jgi:signal transduction histidine kinase/ActR/RegA family two-component response regulator